MKRARTAYVALAALTWLFTLTHGAHAAAPSVGQCLGSAEKWILLRAERKLLAARAELSVCSQPSCPGDIREECGLRLTEINALLPSVVFAVVDPEEHPIEAARISIDGNSGVAATDAPVLLDPGVHRVRFERDGYTPMEHSFELSEGQAQRRERVVLTPLPSRQPSQAPPSRDGERGRGTRPLQITGIALAGAGTVAFATSVIFALKAQSSYNDSNADGHCQAAGCDLTGLRARDDAFSAARFSTGFFVAGAVLAATGVTLFFVDCSRARETATRVVLTGSGVSLRGGF